MHAHMCAGRQAGACMHICVLGGRLIHACTYVCWAGVCGVELDGYTATASHTAELLSATGTHPAVPVATACCYGQLLSATGPPCCAPLYQLLELAVLNTVQHMRCYVRYKHTSYGDMVLWYSKHCRTLVAEVQGVDPLD